MTTQTPDPPPTRDVTYFPASAEQERFWLLEELAEDPGVYNVSRAFRLEGPLDVDALRRALAGLLERHEALRTGFREGPQGDLQQGVAPVQRVPLEVVDRSDDDAPGEALAGRLAEEAGAPFDLREGPPCRFRLIRLGPSRAVLQLTFHHIAFDGGSLPVVLSDLEALYRAGTGDGDVPDPPEIQYVDYTRWQRDRLGDGDLDDQLAYWTDRLEGCEPVTVPPDRPRPPVPSHTGEEVRVPLDEETVHSLRKIAGDEGATGFMSFLALLKVLLSRYTGRSDLVIGTSVAARTVPEARDVVGPLLNNLPLRTEIDPEAGFREALARVRRTCLEAFDHQEIPVAEIVSEVAPERSATANPLYRVFFELNRRDREALDLPGLDVAPEPIDRTVMHFDLRLTVWESDDGFELALGFDPDLYDRGTAERLAGHLATLARGAARDPDRPVADLRMLPKDERRRVVEEWAVAEDPDLDDRPMHELLSRTARAHPDEPAVSGPDGTLTYRDLEDRANRLAHLLLDRFDLEADTPVAFYLPRTTDLVTATFGILRTGACYVPLEPEHPAERLAFMLRDTDAPAVLTTSALAPELPDTDAAVVRLDEIRDDLEAYPPEAPDVRVRPDDLAYVAYTSGSTGQPKGVAVEHGSVRNFHEAMVQAEYSVVEGSLDVAWTCSVSFDTTWDSLSLLVEGHTVHVIPKDLRLDPARLAAYLRDHDVRVLSTTPSAFEQLAEQDVLDGAGPVRLALLGGEPMPAAVWDRIRRTDGLDGFNNYGPTEATVQVAGARIEGDTEPHLGGPLPGSRLYVVDEELRPVPVGVPGELLIGGIQVARGYLGRPELTRERFVPDTVTGDPDARLYRTGDLVAWRPDGHLDFVGRKDEQVKIRGFRVEPGEVEATLADHADVDQALVVPRADGDGATSLLGYVATDRPDDVTPAMLRSHLRDRLPDYMIPSRFFVLDRFPLTPNEKIDRDALPEPEGRPDLEAAFEPPGDPVEEEIADLFGDVLDLDRVGVHDDFFKLGGDSLKAMHIVGRIRKAHDTDLDLAGFFSDPTVRALAGTLEEAASTATPGPSAAADRRRRHGIRLDDADDAGGGT